MAFRASPPLLSLETAARDLHEAEQTLRNLLLTAHDLRIQMELAQLGAPDISEALAALAKIHRYDACKSLIAAFEDFAEAQVNFHLAKHRQDYERVVEPAPDPEYLRDGSGG